MFPLLTRWQLEQETAGQINRSYRGFVVPSHIKKKRNPRAIPCYEIVWKDEHQYFCDLIPDEQVQAFLLENDNNLESLWSTIEPAVLVDRVYPALIVDFEAAKLAKKKTKRPAKSPSTKVKRTKKAKPSDSLNDFAAMQAELDAISKEKTKPGAVAVKKPRAVRSIEQFLKAASPVRPKVTMDDSILLPLVDCDFNDDCENILDLSNLISGIVSSSPVVKSVQGNQLIYTGFSDEEVGVSVEKNQSMDDIDLMIMKRKQVNPKHKRVNSLRKDLLLSSSTPNAKQATGRAVEREKKEEKVGEGSFFAPTEENDIFELSYNALIDKDGCEEKDQSDSEEIIEL